MAQDQLKGQGGDQCGKSDRGRAAFVMADQRRARWVVEAGD